MIQNDAMRNMLCSYGINVVGVDSVFKLTDTRTPCWILTVMNKNTNMGAVGGIILAGSSSIECFSKGLSQIQKYLVTFLQFFTF